MDPVRLVKLLLPKLPLLIKTFVLNKLGLSPNCDKQDARTEVVVALIRTFVQTRNEPLEVVQRRSMKGPEIKGRMWISKTIISAPDMHVRELVVQGIKLLGDGTEKYMLPDISDVEGEWTGFRSGVDKKAPRPDISEQQQYANLMKDTSSNITILYFHGGGMVVMDPASHRKVTSALAQKTGGRCFSVRYRLAPQHPFPSQLLDALISYLYLLAPPPGSFHDAVPPQNLVLAGDSAGGNIAFSLLLLIITLQKAGVKTVSFHGRDVPLALPAGVAGNSPWLDPSRSIPDLEGIAKYDYLDPNREDGVDPNTFPPDEIWPAKPPREDMFLEVTAFGHPLACPIAATPEMWKGAPPAFMCIGTEGIAREVAVTARRMYQSGSKVDLLGYEGQPHCFAMIFPTSVPGRDCMRRWADFCVAVVKGNVKNKDTGLWMKALSNPPRFSEIELSSNGISDEELKRLIQRRKDMALEREKEAIKQYERSTGAKL